MGRLRLGVVIVVLLGSLAAAPAAGAAFLSGQAKDWTERIAEVGARPAGGVHERQAGGIVRRRLLALGYDMQSQWFSIPGGKRSRNVIGRTPGTIRVIIVAHIDGVRRTQAANDNASGIGTMLELARNLRTTNGVLVAAIGAEERAVTGSSRHLGSRRLVRSLTANQKDGVRLAVSIDMVGVGTTLHVRGIEASPNRSARRLLAAARRADIPATYLRDTGQSDHDELTYGGVAAAWMQWRWDTCWHEPCDRPGRVQRSKLRPAGRTVLHAARAVLG
ncbi:MAG: M28 family metallopeptidase [Gaiellaceae bacterium]